MYFTVTAEEEEIHRS